MTDSPDKQAPATSGKAGKVVWALVVLSALLLGVEVLAHRHGYFAVENLFGFYAFFGLLAGIGMVLVAKALRFVLMRPEDFYDSDD